MSDDALHTAILDEQRLPAEEWATVVMKRGLTRNLDRAVAPIARRIMEGKRSIWQFEADGNKDALPDNIKRLYQTLSPEFNPQEIVKGLDRLWALAGGICYSSKKLDEDFKVYRATGKLRHTFLPSEIRPELEKLNAWIQAHKDTFFQGEEEKRQLAKYEQALTFAARGDLFTDTPAATTAR